MYSLDKNRLLSSLFQKQETSPRAHDMNKRDGPKKASYVFSPSSRATFLALLNYICILYFPFSFSRFSHQSITGNQQTNTFLLGKF